MVCVIQRKFVSLFLFSNYSPRHSCLRGPENPFFLKNKVDTGSPGSVKIINEYGLAFKSGGSVSFNSSFGASQEAQQLLRRLVSFYGFDRRA